MTSTINPFCTRPFFSFKALFMIFSDAVYFVISPVSLWQ